MVSESTRANKITWNVASALFVVAFACGLFVRVLALDGVPLSGDEAAQVLWSWNWLHGSASSFVGSPLLFSLNVVVFALFGASDLTARIVPALIGSGVILLPVLLREQLGRVGALVAAFVLAFSPSLVFFSRQADGAMLASTFGLAALTFAWRYLNLRAQRDANFAAVFAALALLSSPEVWTIALALILFTLMIRAGWVTHLAPKNSGFDFQVARQSGIIFVATFVGFATFLLLHRAGIGDAFSLLGTWLDGWMPGGSLFDPFRALVVYEPIALFFGVAAIVDLSFAWRTQSQERPLLFAFGVWALVAFFLLAFSGDKNPARVVVAVVPFILLASYYIGTWTERLIESIRFSPAAMELLLTQEAPVLFLASAITGFLYLLIAEFAMRGGLSATDTLSALMGRAPNPDAGGTFVALIIFIGILSVTFVTLATVGVERAKNVAVFFLLVVLSVWTIRQVAFVNFAGAPHGTAHFFGLNPQELLITRATSPSVRDLADDVRDVSRWRANHVYSLVLAIDASLSPVVRWELRDFPYARIMPSPAPLDHQALILPVDAPAPGADWIAQSYRVGTVRVPQSNFLRWFLFRDLGAVESVNVVLWIPKP